MLAAVAFAALIWSADGAGAGEGDLLSSSSLYSSAAGGCAGARWEWDGPGAGAGVSEEGAATGEVLGGAGGGGEGASAAADGAEAVGGLEIGECASWDWESAAARGADAGGSAVGLGASSWDRAVEASRRRRSREARARGNAGGAMDGMEKKKKKAGAERRAAQISARLRWCGVVWVWWGEVRWPGFILEGRKQSSSSSSVE